MQKKVKVALYGCNGHQIHYDVVDHKNAELVAVCDMNDSALDFIGEERMKNIKIYDSLEEMLTNDEIDIVSICSSKRINQENDIIKCLKAGKHVYAEKPAVFSEKALELVLKTAKECEREFHEMADTIFVEPYWSAHKMVTNGVVGDVVQVYIQKSYPMRLEYRPQDEITDGGLIRWAGIHGIRFLEHITGLKVTDMQVVQTRLGNTRDKNGMFTASSWAMKLENGGVASACVNYLNPTSFPRWGNESVRIFGTEGMLEITDGGLRTHLYSKDMDCGEFDLSNSDCKPFVDYLFEHLRYGSDMPFTIDEELHPLRTVIRAFDKAVINQ